MSSALQIQSPVQTLALGDVTLQIRQYRLRMECPIAKQMLCSGEPRWTLLGAVPCILTVRGKIAAENAASLLAALRTFFMQHTAFSFTFLDAAFADMQISAMDYQCDENGHLTEYSLTFIGQLTGGTA
jgi:hypothetical protein